MYTITQVSEMTGVSAYTLRYYEKIGLLPAPIRKRSGARFYSESDVQFMNFLNGLKKTGMSLDDIAEFVKDGCIMKKVEESEEVTLSIERRTEILQKHLKQMETQRQQLDDIITLTKEKISIYQKLVIENNQGGEFK